MPELIDPLTALAIDFGFDIMNALGLIFMKIAHKEAEAINKTGGNQNSFTTKRWMIGFVCVFVGSFGHVFMLPFADMTLFTTTCSLAILVTMGLSMVILGEKLIPKYDFSAAIFICIGSGLTIL
jgi:hypothetical protein